MHGYESLKFMSHDTMENSNFTVQWKMYSKMPILGGKLLLQLVKKFCNIYYTQS